MLFFWYCMDDWMATVTQSAWVGSVPWWVVLLAHIPFGIFTVTVNRQ